MIFKPGQFIQHEELFLERIAANYVSFTLQDENMNESEASVTKKGKKTEGSNFNKTQTKKKTSSNLGGTSTAKKGGSSANYSKALSSDFYNAIAQSIF